MFVFLSRQGPGVVVGVITTLLGKLTDLKAAKKLRNHFEVGEKRWYEQIAFSTFFILLRIMYKWCRGGPYHNDQTFYERYICRSTRYSRHSRSEIPQNMVPTSPVAGLNFNPRFSSTLNLARVNPITSIEMNHINSIENPETKILSDTTTFHSAVNNS